MPNQPEQRPAREQQEEARQRVRALEAGQTPKRARMPFIPGRKQASARLMALLEDGNPATSDGTAEILQDIRAQIMPEYADGLTDNERRLFEGVIVRVGELFRRAKAGDRAAAWKLYQAASLCVARLDQLEDFQAEITRDMAHQSPYWPVAVVPTARGKAELERRLRQLQLGKLCCINSALSSRAGQKARKGQNLAENPVAAGEVVRSLYMHVMRRHSLLWGLINDGTATRKDFSDPIDRRILGLRQLSKATAAEWHKRVLWPLVMLNHGGHPERDATLRRFGLHKSESYERTRGRKRGSAEKTREANIRAAIKAALGKALQSMAAPAPPWATLREAPAALKRER